MQGTYPLTYSIAISWCIDWSEPLRYGSKQRAREGWAGNMCHCWMQPCSSRGPFLYKRLLLLLPFIPCVIKPWEEWLALCGGGRGHSFPAMISHCTSRTSVLPLSHPLASVSPPVPRAPFPAFAVLLGVLGFVRMPRADFDACKDESIRERHSYHLLPHEKGLGQHKVLNGISKALDPMEKQVSFLSVRKQDRGIRYSLVP